MTTDFVSALDAGRLGLSSRVDHRACDAAAGPNQTQTNGQELRSISKLLTKLLLLAASSLMYHNSQFQNE
jgi:hypothetical protein